MTERERAEELFHAVERCLMGDSRPSQTLERLFSGPVPAEFAIFQRLKTTGQSPAHHPEGSVWAHTMLVVDEAAKRRGESRDPAALMWAALLHDIGKPDTTRIKKGRITSYDHDKVGADLARRFLERFDLEPAFIGRVCGLVRYHMHILFVCKDLPFADVEGMKAHTDLREVALLGLCDRLGRGGADRLEEAKNIRIFLEKCGGEKEGSGHGK